jgi:hypothetical protein
VGEGQEWDEFTEAGVLKERDNERGVQASEKIMTSVWVVRFRESSQSPEVYCNCIYVSKAYPYILARAQNFTTSNQLLEKIFAINVHKTYTLALH